MIYDEVRSEYMAKWDPWMQALFFSFVVLCETEEQIKKESVWTSYLYSLIDSVNLAISVSLLGFSWGNRQNKKQTYIYYIYL